MTERAGRGCDKCISEWGDWRSDDTKRTYVDRMATSASTGQELFRCNACRTWWEFHVLDGRPHPCTIERVDTILAEIKENP